MSKAKAEEVKEVKEVVAPVADASTEDGPVQLNLQDLQAIANIVDLASRRGAFHAKEMSAVGESYSKLTDFLEHISSQQESK